MLKEALKDLKDIYFYEYRFKNVHHIMGYITDSVSPYVYWYIKLNQKKVAMYLSQIKNNNNVISLDGNGKIYKEVNDFIEDNVCFDKDDMGLARLRVNSILGKIKEGNVFQLRIDLNYLTHVLDIGNNLINDTASLMIFLKEYFKEKEYITKEKKLNEKVMRHFRPVFIKVVDELAWCEKHANGFIENQDYLDNIRNQYIDQEFFDILVKDYFFFNPIDDGRSGLPLNYDLDDFESDPVEVEEQLEYLELPSPTVRMEYINEKAFFEDTYADIANVENWELRFTSILFSGEQWNNIKSRMYHDFTTEHEFGLSLKVILETMENPCITQERTNPNMLMRFKLIKNENSETVLKEMDEFRQSIRY